MAEKMIAKSALSPVDGDALNYVMSDETVDNMGDVVEVKGLKLDRFLKNPIALFGHDDMFVIGHWTNVRVQGKQLLGRLNLLPQGISERLDEIRAAVKAGVLRGVSVGFTPDPLQAEPIKGGGIRFRAGELLECSLCSIPANPNALQIAKSLNLSSDVQAMIFKSAAETAPSGNVSPAPKGKLHPVVKLSDPARVRAKPFVINKIHH